MAVASVSDTPNSELTIKSRVFVVENYWFHQRSPSTVVNEYSKQFGKKNAPTPQTVLNIVKKFHDNGTVLDLRKGKAGPKVTQNTEENAERVSDYFDENPTTSTRRASVELGIPRSTLRRIIKSKLKLYPYKIQVFQELSEFDMERRVEFANHLLAQIESNDIQFGKIWFSDECHFWLSGYVNKQNYRFWARENPRIFTTTSTKPKRVSVWCAISTSGVLGPYFFESNVNGENYRKMLSEYFIPTASGLNCIHDFHFMQDGALPHRTGDVLDLLNDHFHERVIGLGYMSRFGDGMDWPPYSPDLNPCDYYLWGCLKDRVYRSAPKSIDDLKKAIQTEIEKIALNEIKEAIRNFRERLRAVIECEGGHIEAYMH